MHSNNWKWPRSTFLSLFSSGFWQQKILFRETSVNKSNWNVEALECICVLLSQLLYYNLYHCYYKVSDVSHLFLTLCMRRRKAQMELCLALDRRNSAYLLENSMSPSCLLRSRPADSNCLKHNHINNQLIWINARTWTSGFWCTFTIPISLWFWPCAFRLCYFFFYNVFSQYKTSHHTSSFRATLEFIRVFVSPDEWNMNEYSHSSSSVFGLSWGKYLSI